MTKKQTIEVIGYTNSNIIAKTHEAAQVIGFIDSANHFHITNINDRSVELITAKGSYFLWKSNKGINKYIGKAAGVKIHFAMKKIVGKLIYWS